MAICGLTGLQSLCFLPRSHCSCHKILLLPPQWLSQGWTPDLTEAIKGLGSAKWIPPPEQTHSSESGHTNSTGVGSNPISSGEKEMQGLLFITLEEDYIIVSLFHNNQALETSSESCFLFLQPFHYSFLIVLSKNEDQNWILSHNTEYVTILVIKHRY